MHGILTTASVGHLARTVRKSDSRASKTGSTMAASGQRFLVGPQVSSSRGINVVREIHYETH